MDAYDKGSEGRQDRDSRRIPESRRGPDPHRPQDSRPDPETPASSVPAPSAAPACASPPPIPPPPSSSPLSAPSPRPLLGGGSAGPEATDRPSGIAALSPRYRVVAALALAVVAVTACVHLGMVFLHLAPSNTVSKQHGKTIDDWIYPEFEQNWKLFAPNPLQQNIAVQVRAEVRTADGDVRTTGWYDLSAQDGEAVDGNPLPSHTQQNELRRAWDFYTATHDDENRPNGVRGTLSESYLRRITVMRLDREDAGGRGAVVDRVQVRSRTTNVPPPKWSDEKVSDQPTYRLLPWWEVTSADRPAGTGAEDGADAAAAVGGGAEADATGTDSPAGARTDPLADHPAARTTRTEATGS